MKHTIAFILLLAIILALGYYSVDSADLFSQNSQLEQTHIPRSQDHNNAVYIAGEETGFKPMDIIEEPDFATLIPSDDKTIRNICTAIILVLSCYYENTECPDSFAEAFSDSLNYSNNGYVYTEKFEYENFNGQTRYIDCIFKNDNYRLVYLRFYSPETYELSSDETEAALEAFDKDSTSFYSSTGEEIEKLIAINEPDPYYDNESDYDKTIGSYNDFEFEYNIGKDDSFEYNYEHLKYIYDSTEIYSDSETVNFWIKSCLLSRYIVNEGSYYLSCVAHIVEGIMISDNYSEPEYTIYQGRIYQTVQFGGNQLVTIYNIAENRIEGFFAPSYYD